MRSLILSAVLGVATLVSFFGSTSEAQAQRWGRGGGWGVSVGPVGVYSGTGYYGGYGRSYYGSPYYGNSYYYSQPYYSSDYGTSYYYSTPSTTTSYYSAPSTTTYSNDSRYQYYWSNGWYMCYDRTTGEYWYQDPNSKYWYRWRS